MKVACLELPVGLAGGTAGKFPFPSDCHYSITMGVGLCKSFLSFGNFLWFVCFLYFLGLIYQVSFQQQILSL